MTQQAIDFVIKTFALTFAIVFGIISITICGAVFFLGDGEAQKLVGDLTAPFLGITGSFVAAFLGHWAFTLRQASAPGGTPNTVNNSSVAQLARYEAQQWAAGVPAVQSYPQGAHGPLVDRIQALRGNGDAPSDPGAQMGQTGEHANGH